jgi:hypothetical protein
MKPPKRAHKGFLAKKIWRVACPERVKSFSSVPKAPWSNRLGSIPGHEQAGQRKVLLTVAWLFGRKLPNGSNTLSFEEHPEP